MKPLPRPWGIFLSMTAALAVGGAILPPLHPLAADLAVAPLSLNADTSASSDANPCHDLGGRQHVAAAAWRNGDWLALADAADSLLSCPLLDARQRDVAGLQAARAARSRGNLHDVRRHVADVSAESAVADEARWVLMAALTDAGLREEALALCRAFITRRQDAGRWPEALLMEVDLLAALGRAAEALAVSEAHARRVATLQTGRTRFIPDRFAADLLMRQTRLARSLGDVARHDEGLRALVLRHGGSSALEELETNAGADFLDRLSAAAGDNPDTLRALVAALSASGRLMLAFELFDAWRNAHTPPDPVDEPRMTAARAALLHDRRSWAEAAALLEDLLRRLPDHPDASVWRIRLAGERSRIGDEIGAADAYQDAAMRAAGSDQAWWFSFLASWQRGLGGQFAQARQGLTVLVDEPRLPWRDRERARWYRGWFAYRAGDFPAALADFDELGRQPRKGPYAEGLVYWSGRVLQRMGRSAEARTRYREAASAARPDYYALLAWRRLSAMQTGAGANKDTWRPPWLPVSAVSGVSACDDAGYAARLRSNAAELSARATEPDLLAAARSLSSACDVYLPLQRALALTAAGDDEAARLEGDLFLAAMKQSLRHGRHRLPTACRAPREALAAIPLFEAMAAMGAEGKAFRLAQGRYGALTAPQTPDSAAARKLPPFFADLLLDAAARRGAPPDFAGAIVLTESHFLADAVSPVGARGLMQLMPTTARRVAASMGRQAPSADMLFIPAENISLGMWYLGALRARFGGSLALTAAAYNAGPFMVVQWQDRSAGLPVDEFVEGIPFKETREYVRRVMARTAAYRLHYQGCVSLDDLTAPPPPRTGDQPDF